MASGGRKIRSTANWSRNDSDRHRRQSVVHGKEAMEHLSEIGTVVYLKLPYDVLVRRLGNLKDRGVVLKEGQTLKGLYEERTPLYEKYAQLTVDEETLGIRETVELVAEALKKE